MFLYSVCLTDIRQALATPLSASGNEKLPSLSELLSIMSNSLTNQLKLTLHSLKVSAANNLVSPECSSISCEEVYRSTNNITIEFMFAGINMFWARLRLRAKMSLRRAQNIFMPKNINSITINITLEGIEEIKTEKK